MRPRTAAIILIVLYLIVGTIDYAAAKVSHLMLLEISSLPASMEECLRARPDLGRPAHVVSLQNGTLTPWHRRTCIYQ